jgi:hypothetical protein
MDPLNGDETGLPLFEITRIKDFATKVYGSLHSPLTPSKDIATRPLRERGLMALESGPFQSVQFR